MADLYTTYAESLEEEVLTELAENFFGTRKALDQKIDRLYELADQLRAREDAVLGRFSFLAFVLLRGRLAGEFWAALGVEPTEGMLTVGELHSRDRGERQRALTGRARWTKYVAAAYGAASDAVREHLLGSVYVDSSESDREDGEPGPEHASGEAVRLSGGKRKKLSVHYRQLVAMHAHVNAEIDRVNRDLPPSGALGYVKQFDVERVEKEKITGGGSALGEKLDAGLCFRPVDFDSLRLRAFPELPPLDKVSGTIQEFCKARFDANREELSAIMDEIAG